MNNLEKSKKELQKISEASKMNTNIDIESIFDIVKETDKNITVKKSQSHSTINPLTKIKEILASKKIIVNEAGLKEEVPVYAEDEKVKIIFALLAEKGLNLLDSLEGILEKDGYRYGSGGDGSFEEGSNKLVENINKTFEKTTDILREISEMQFKKSKLELEKENLRIQDYKAKLKEKELLIKEKAVNKAIGNSGNTNIIAVASQAELIALMKKQNQEIETKEAEIISEDSNG